MDPLTITRLTGITNIDISLADVTIRLAVAFILACTIALTYRKTHKSFAYSYSMVVAIILNSIIVSMVLMVIDNSLARAFGLVGALAIIRFRTPVKDIRDIVFLFLSIANGIAAGAGAFKIGVVGVLSADIIAYLMYSAKFGTPRAAASHLLKLVVNNEAILGEDGEIDNLLREYCESYEIIEAHAAGNAPRELIFNITLMVPDKLPNLLDETAGIPTVEHATILSSVHNMDVQ